MDDYKPEAWRMTGYYPGQYAKSSSALGIGIDYSDDDYDRYEAEFMADLAVHDAEVKREAKAEALEEVAERLVRPTYRASMLTGVDQSGVLAASAALHGAADRLDERAAEYRKTPETGDGNE